MYYFAVPSASISGGPDIHVNEGSTINLTCVVKFSPEPPAYIFWYHYDEVCKKINSYLFITNKYYAHWWEVLFSHSPITAITHISTKNKQCISLICDNDSTIYAKMINFVQECQIISPLIISVYYIGEPTDVATKNRTIHRYCVLFSVYILQNV